MEFEGIPKVQFFSETSKFVLKIGGYSGGVVRVFDEDRRCKSNRTTRLVADTWCVWGWFVERIKGKGNWAEIKDKGNWAEIKDRQRGFIQGRGSMPCLLAAAAVSEL